MSSMSQANRAISTQSRSKTAHVTKIYWLVDMRPETIAVGKPHGQPFYVGKTCDETKRLAGHLKSAAAAVAGEWKWNTPLHRRLRECGKYVQIVVLETAPPELDGLARESHWIAVSRRMFPEFMTNTYPLWRTSAKLRAEYDRVNALTVSQF